MEIRRATDTDADAAADVFTSSRRDAGDAIPPAVHTPDEDRAFVRNVLIAERETWLAVDGARVMGLLVLDGDFLDQLYVSSGAQRSGVGSSLVAFAKKQRPRGLQLWAFESNRPARAFYQRHGFVEAERTDGALNEERAPDVRYVWVP